MVHGFVTLGMLLFRSFEFGEPNSNCFSCPAGNHSSRYRRDVFSLKEGSRLPYVVSTTANHISIRQQFVRRVHDYYRRSCLARFKSKSKLFFNRSEDGGSALSRRSCDGITRVGKVATPFKTNCKRTIQSRLIDYCTSQDECQG